jgi:hypothetical protein
LEFCRYLRSLFPPETRIPIVMDNYRRHLSTVQDSRDWAAANNVKLADVPTNASFLNRIEFHFAPLRYFGHDGQLSHAVRPTLELSLRWPPTSRWR